MLIIMVKLVLPDWKNKRTFRIFAILSVIAIFTGLLTSKCYIDSAFGPQRSPTRISEPWGSFYPGDHQTCLRAIPLLLAPSTDEGENSAEIFSWPTPKFSDLLLYSANRKSVQSDKDALSNILCDKYKAWKAESIDLENSDVKPSLTDISKSFYTVDDQTVKVESVIRVYIETRNSLGERTATGGGDFFKIRAENPFTQSSVAASRITYQGNGKYEVEIKTFWKGRHDIKIFFAQSGHFVDLVKRLTSQSFSVSAELNGEFTKKTCSNNTDVCSTKHKERAPCHINTLILDSSQELCNFTNNNGEGWFCNKPKSPLHCKDLNSVYASIKRNFLDILQLFPLHDRGTLNRKTIAGNPPSLDVTHDGKDTGRKLPQCTPGLKTPHPAGYWLGGFWKSCVCDNVHYSVNTAAKADCLRHRTVYFIGDSTARQWFEYFVVDLRPSYKKPFMEKDAFLAQETSSFNDVWEPRTARIELLNTTFYYRAHGQPLQNGGLAYASKFTSSQLDEIERLPDQGHRLTVVIAIGPHFLMYNPDEFLNRILIIRDAALRLLNRNPLATIIIKGSTTFIRGIGIGHCCLSDWLSFRFHKLAKYVFDGTPIVYLDVWDMTVSHPSEDFIHPVREVVENEIDLALSFSCSRFK